MEFEVEREGGNLVLKAGGRIDGSNSFEFQTKVEEAIGDANCSVVLNLGNLTYISSAGLRVILLLAKTIRGKSEKFVICSVVGSVQEVFEISGFGSIIPIYDNQAEALTAISN